MESPVLDAQNHEDNVIRKGIQSEKYVTFEPFDIKERYSHATPHQRYSRLTFR